VRARYSRWDGSQDPFGPEVGAADILEELSDEVLMGGSADAALERLALHRVAPVAHGRLSQGQRRRVALAIAVARDPRLLLLDEPHAGLDEQGREVLDAVVRAAPAEGRTVLLASHELELARRLATREVRITAGQVHDVRPAVSPTLVPRTEVSA